MSTSPVKVKKTLGVFSLVMINIIAVDSLRTLPFSAEYGFSLVFYYILGAIVFLLPIAFVAAELATGWSSKGGIYIWVREAFGEFWGFMVIWLQWVYNIIWYPTILSFVVGAMAYMINPHLVNDKTYMLTMVLIIFWGATIINCFGMRISSIFSSVAALGGTLIPMLFIIILGAIWCFEGRPEQISFSWHTFLPDISSIKNVVFLSAILFGLIGVEMSSVHADEVDNPGKSYPRAILISTVIILLTLVFASLAIAIVVPQEKLNIVTGLIQAFQIFFASFNMRWMDPIITLLIIIGGIGGVAAWIIGPTKGLLVATQDGSAPPIFAKTNKKGVPIVILFMQAIIFSIICGVFLLMPSVTSSYWVLTAMTAQLAMMVYITIFAAGIYLRYKRPDVKRAYKIPGGKIGMWVAGVFGICSSSGAIILGFIPPSQIQVGNLFTYEAILIVGMIVFFLPPVIIYRCKRPEWKLN